MKRLIVVTAALACAITFARAETNDEYRHANREQGCRVLNTVLPGVSDPSYCQQLVALMEIGPGGKAFESCSVSLTNAIPGNGRLSRIVADTILVGCSMAAYGVGEETARRTLQRMR